MRILINGIGGFMGKELARLCEDGCRGAVLAAGADPNGSDCPVPCAADIRDAETDVDCVVDFSHHSCTEALLAFCVKNRLPLVLATTGQTDAERAAIRTASEKIPVFFAANFSLGVALLLELAKRAAKALPDAEIEIIETHHSRKLDAPSGTALALAEAIREVRPEATVHAGRSGTGKRDANEIGIHSVRMGNIVGEHEVLLCTANQTISLKHTAHSRALFAEGALAAAEFLCGKPAGLYTMQDILLA